MKKESRIILALDVEDRNKALKICEEVEEYIDAIKIGYPLVLSSNLEILAEIKKKFSKPLIADFKVADIPEISKRICKLAVEKGADYVIVHGFMGEEVIKACSEVANIFVVADMSHPGAERFMSRHSQEIAEISRKYAYGIVAPATRPGQISKLRKIVKDLTIISPGVKAQGAKVGDAIKAGADFEIIGRGIYQAPNPKEAVQEFSRIISNVKFRFDSAVMMNDGRSEG